MSKQKSAVSLFKEKLERIEEISALLEDQEIDLEKAILLYEEGMKLSQECIVVLKDAELKITELKNSFKSN
ncbi:MAG: exodeoxyribonuclease VII small subunit [Ignavibacteriales bacterium]|nr:MAG: exodeoxyribonuclease VII small subunit [Ignavibacteriaceae bacterium]MBW7871872.1 exodeoxyribonuclease VII small subunit [Ignavibacteria bacterium]MCZ2144278.1 exodeoxyribonuclease VII small subunit [Ignavibacteriales bacterium]OQY74794.1 MAG: exodeoxyribonuclease VII small subunit [Ignavibacteriales bacterium UTCHB3]MBV6446231.1 Exodeoxyribonuclease 7 small subunit [Ignavibacteriaceae bacterium]